MNHNFEPVIIVIAYNRVNALQRILNSLNMAICPEGTKLIISIDNNGTNQEVAVIANEYQWNFGEKQVIYRVERLGLRRHIITCGDMIYQYGSTIIIEEDMVVSPFFYKFAQEALNYYNDSQEIAGMSLYSLPYTEACKLPFIPLRDDSSVYFAQVPCSLGMVYSVRQWDDFKKWLILNPDLKQIKGLPLIVTKYWSESSWKKYMYGYMVVSNKYFIYPQISLTSNFNDRGENMYAKSYVGQVGLQMVPIKFKFKSVDESLNVYDAYSEILADRLKILCKTLNDYDFEVDLFGQKESFSKEYVITSKKCKKRIIGFERAMKPAELNVVYNIPGTELSFAKSEDVIFDSKTIDDLIFKTMAVEEFIDIYNYFYTNVFDTKVLFKILKFRLKNKFRNIFKKQI
jgi:hypothetical protein